MSREEAEGLLPGEELVRQGLLDLSQRRVTDCSLLLLVAAPRLKRLGIQVPDQPFPGPCEHRLYGRLERRLGAAAHSYYNSLLRRIDSYACALEREQDR
jgi:hypothetical protein